MSELTVQTAHASALHQIVAGEKAYLSLGCWLVKMEDDTLWDTDTYERYNDYLEAPRHSGGLGMEKRAHQRCRQVARRFVHELEIPFERLVELPAGNLQETVGVVNENNVEEVLSDVEVLTVRDIRENRSKGKYNGVVEPLEAQTPTPTPVSTVTCPGCGKEIEL